MFVIASLAIVAVCTYGTLPYSMSGVKLFAKAAAVWEWEGSSRVASRHFFIMILGRREPSKTVITGVFDCRGEGYSPGTHDFGSVVVRDEGAVIEVWMDAGDDSSVGETASVTISDIAIFNFLFTIRRGL